MVSVMRKSITNGDEIGHYYCDNNGDFDNKGRSIDRYKQKERKRNKKKMQLILRKPSSFI